MDWALVIAAIGAFLAVFLGVFAANMVLADLFLAKAPHGLPPRTLDASPGSPAFPSLRNAGSGAGDGERSAANQSHLGELADAAASNSRRLGPAERLRELIEQSGVSITPLQFVSYTAAGALSLMLLFWLPLQAPKTGIVASLLGALAPLMFISHMRKRRVEALRSQLPDALELMARVLRSGQTVSQAMHSVADEFPAPLGTEFGYCYEQQNLGLAPDIALRELARRTGAMEVRIFVMALMVHRQAGGNITELFDRLAHVVRQRFRLRGEVQALTAEGRMQALLLLGLPVMIWVALFFLNRPYALSLFNHEWLVYGMLGAMVIGALWIRKIVNFEF
jgi:tight adherence protein B